MGFLLQITEMLGDLISKPEGWYALPSFFLLSLPFSPSPPLSSLLPVVKLIFTGKDHGDLDREEIDSGHYEGRREKSENRQSAGSK